MGSKVICVDFDGTIARTNYPIIKEAYPEALIYIRKWRRNGHKVILFTCREDKYLEEALEYCKTQGIQFDAVNENLPELIKEYRNDPRKLGCDYMIDDKFPMPVSLQWKTVNQLLGGE